MAEGWLAPIDAYCERTGPEFWSEPVNALTNAAFLVAALAAGVRAARQPVAARSASAAWLLVALIAIIGVGSFLFHTFANRWSVLADVIPIAAFILVYFALAMRCFVGLGWVWAIVATALFEAASVAFGLLWSSLARAWGGDPLNGSAGYLPALAAMVVIGALLLARPTVADTGRRLILAALVFAASVLLRMADQAVCSAWPLGTHFAWHALNGLVLYLLTDAFIRHGTMAAAASGAAAAGVR